jgi:cytochrome c oxidase cbb3-type subunit IV
MNAGLISGLVTGLLLLTFLGGVAWAWSGRRKQEFDEAARLPLEDGE